MKTFILILAPVFLFFAALLSGCGSTTPVPARPVPADTASSTAGLINAVVAPETDGAKTDDAVTDTIAVATDAIRDSVVLRSTEFTDMIFGITDSISRVSGIVPGEAGTHLSGHGSSGNGAGIPGDTVTAIVEPGDLPDDRAVNLADLDLLSQDFPVLADLRFEVNIRERELYVMSEGERIATYPVAVGQPEWPTRTGRWGIYKVVWNPWWHPPDEEWAWNYAIMAPGDPDNPLGRAQLIYDAPRSIHGTINPSSVGHAVSHGSIRVTNEVAMKLSRLVMEYSGIKRDESWYERMKHDRNRNIQFSLPARIPIRVY